MIKRIKKLLEDISKFSGNPVTFEDRKIIQNNMDKLSPMKITLLINKNKNYHDKINIYDVIDAIEIIRKDQDSKYVINTKSNTNYTDIEDTVKEPESSYEDDFYKSKFTEEEIEFLKREYANKDTQELFELINSKRPSPKRISSIKVFRKMVSNLGLKKLKKSKPGLKNRIFKDRDEYREYLKRLELLRQLKRKEKLNTKVKREYKKKFET